MITHPTPISLTGLIAGAASKGGSVEAPQSHRDTMALTPGTNLLDPIERPYDWDVEPYEVT